MSSMQHLIADMEERVLSGLELSAEEAVQLLDAQGPDQMSLFAAANRIRHHFCGSEVHLCGIVNAKSGACSEDCTFCSQAVQHPTQVEQYSLLEPDALLKESRKAALNGAKAFGIVTAWRGIKKGKSLDIICEAIRKIKSEGRVIPDLSLGLIDDIEVAEALVEAGAVEYNHNLEAAPSFFPNICTTHSFEDRVRTIQICRTAGLKVCSGGIVGVGETDLEKAQLAAEIRNLDVNTVPLNFYHHTEGNAVPVRDIKPISAMEALSIVAMFRFILPDRVLKVAGGRESTLGHLQPMMFLAGANSTMVGHYLTTSGRQAQDDFDMIEQCGMTVTHGCSSQASPVEQEAG